MLRDEIILGLDVSTTCIGISIAQYDGENTKVLYINKVRLKTPKGYKGTDVLFDKTRQFREAFMEAVKDSEITMILLEEPLVRSNNVMTVELLLRFNGMISQMIHDVTGLVPQYISSYDARKFAFPELCAIRKFNKKGEQYPVDKVRSSVKKGELVLFGDYAWDCDKKYILWNKISEMYPNIQWEYDKHGQLHKTNFDASDSLVCILGYINKKRYEGDEPEIVDYSEETFEVDGKKVVMLSYDTRFCGKICHKELNLSVL
ncbi:MAG: hypothetical protein LUD72_09545 [Bacteroidales bacterium]|nr:hypothetical protein [Bacteroidales bacterium]